jgi:hypothetical protein
VVAWFNQRWLFEPLGYVPPAEYDEQVHSVQAAQPVPAALN